MVTQLEKRTWGVNIELHIFLFWSFIQFSAISARNLETLRGTSSKFIYNFASKDGNKSFCLLQKTIRLFAI